MPDHYATLGVRPDATADEIRRRYRALIRQLHPDRHRGDPAREETMKRVNAAYAVLSNPASRAAYNRERGYYP